MCQRGTESGVVSKDKVTTGALVSGRTRNLRSEKNCLVTREKVVVERFREGRGATLFVQDWYVVD